MFIKQFGYFYLVIGYLVDDSYNKINDKRIFAVITYIIMKENNDRQ